MSGCTRKPDPRSALRVAVIDPCRLVYSGLRAGAADHEGLELRHFPCVARATESPAAQLDVLVVDPTAEADGTAAALSRLRAAYPRAAVIVFVERLAMGQKVSPLRPPCHLLHKEVEVGEAIGFICRVGEISRRPANVAALEPEAHPRALQRGGLTIQERRVLAHLAGGLSNPEIASALNLTRSTVKTYLQSALRKMGARNRVHALVRAAELGILDPGLARGRPAAPAVPPPHLKGSA